MRILVACPECARQFDASGRPAGGRFRCSCGATLTVPAARGHDAAVIRCSACGAPRQEGAAACGYCGADFTLHERDLHTICPACMARVSDRGRYCHHCATPLLPQPIGPPTRHPCPVCGEEALLTDRGLADEALPVLECQRCAGLWLRRETFEVLRERALRESRPVVGGARPRANAPRPQGGALYRPCPECRALMHRRNYGRRSGVIVDSCAAHGLWFDASELDRLLAWVRGGGEADAARRQVEEVSQIERQSRLLRDTRTETRSYGGGNDWLLQALSRLASRFIG